MKKIAVIFPGIGYTNDRSLLYFSGKIAQNEGYELFRVFYSGFPPGVKGNRDKMKQSFLLAKEQALIQMEKIRWKEYEEVLFISKSIGTVVASAIAKEKQLTVKSIVFTPLAETFQFLNGSAIIFHGTMDPWARTADIIEGCDKGEYRHWIVEGANHSLETGDVLKDIENLNEIMEQVGDFMQGNLKKD